MILENIGASLLGSLIALTSSVGITADSIKAAVPRAQAQVTESSDVQFNWNWGDWRSVKPVINDINPEEGEAGITVTLTGKHFDQDDTVRFGKNTISDVDVAQNGKSLTFVIPDKDAGEYNVRVQDGWKFSNAVQFEITDDADADEPLAIDAISGPTALDAGEEGEWKVDVSSEGEGNLTYSVKWGDENWAPLRLLNLEDEKTQSSAIFTHTYTEEGTYHPEFKVTDEEGNEVKSSLTVTVGDDENNDIPHITLLSATQARVGNTLTITGTNFDEDSTVKVGGVLATNVDVQSDTKLTFKVPALALGTHAVTVKDNDGTSNAVNLKLIALSKVSISGVDAPSRLDVGEEGTWTVNVGSNAGGNLKYSVQWGDEGGLMARMMGETLTQSSATFTHTYETEGTYYPKFTVTDENGVKSSVSASVVVSD